MDARDRMDVNFGAPPADLDDVRGARGGRISPRSASEALQPERVPAPPPRSRAVRHPAVIFLNFVLTVLVVAMIGAAGAVFLAKLQFEAEGPLEQARAVEISPGATLGNVSDLLEHAGIIGNRWVFWIGVKLNKQERNLKAGEYLVPAHASMKTILDAMVSGRGILYSVTIPEGLTSQQIVDRLNAEEMLDGPITAVPKEGALLPETYKFTRGDTRQNILNRMMRERDRVVTDIWNRRVDGLPIGSVDELVTLASIVEKETGLSDERSRVASVFINRLNRDMRLQSDPTVIYGVYGSKGKPADKPITRSDLDARNAYNTYQIDGLPPGPIANPGRASLEAVANPSRTADLYFVADGSGGHAFAASFEEHQRNVARWRQVEARKNKNAPIEATGTAGGTGAAAEVLSAPSANAAPGNTGLAPTVNTGSNGTGGAVVAPLGASSVKRDADRVPLQAPPPSDKKKQ